MDTALYIMSIFTWTYCEQTDWQTDQAKKIKVAHNSHIDFLYVDQVSLKYVEYFLSYQGNTFMPTGRLTDRQT